MKFKCFIAERKRKAKDMAQIVAFLFTLTFTLAYSHSRRPGDKSVIADLRKLNLNISRISPGYSRNHTALDELKKQTLLMSPPSVPSLRQGTVFCDFESPCPWVAHPRQHGFQIVTGRNISQWKDASGPTGDATEDPDGHFLYLKGSKDSRETAYHVYIKKFSHIEGKSCYLKFMFHAHNIKDDMLTIYSETNDSRSVHMEDFKNVANNSWIPLQLFIGSPKQDFQLVLEVLKGSNFPFHAAYDNITLENCFTDSSGKKPCTERSFQCEPGNCIGPDRVCDITTDCPNGEDEKYQCDQLINFNAYCDFEHGMCGWTNNHDDDFEWQLESNKSLQDHTYKNKTGHYMYLSEARKTSLGRKGVLTSAVFPPPPRSHWNIHSPFFNSCQIRFYYRMSGTTRHELEVILVELKPTNNSQIQLWRTYSKEKDWQRVTTVLPHLKHRYQIQFAGSEGMSRMEHIAIDDITLSPECFGIGLQDTNTSTKWYKFSSCGAMGIRGPTSVQCQAAYGNTTNVKIADDGPLAGIQQWTVVESGIYSVFIKGASGGLGANNKRPSKAASAHDVFRWSKGDVIYILVGQEGVSAVLTPETASCSQSATPSSRGISGLKHFLKKCSRGGGGGGGGATFVFKKNEDNESVPLLVAAGGGGLESKMKPGSMNPDGRAQLQTPTKPISGKSSSNGAGGGGGWRGVKINGTGAGNSLLEGAEGGLPCNGSEPWKTEGGFGGGGGACVSGGGGGGYIGGDAASNDSEADNGQGGRSYTSGGVYAHSEGNSSVGPGAVIIVPAFVGCGCEYLCVMLNLENSSYMCICQDGFNLDTDNSTCVVIDDSLPWEDVVLLEHLIIIIPIITVIIICIATVMFFLYQRYRRQTAQTIRQEYVGNHAELQLNRLRQATGGMVTEYNPNYEFGGSTCTIQDLREVQRENLTLVKALGQGAFGEVYQGYLANVPGELRDIAVAIKTLPELSSNQAEMDFLMEALIMSKFTHPNIVRFIGVCFEKLPKFIVLELLPGGDLKSFLRESRPKPDKPSPLTMRDLLMLAIDVAKGCHYLEENHFIHRDIAARNCLLTTKDITRVVKIADFGMARDIYRADYYRKGGKAMLPVKWMPPEAFLDGIFTSKTDVWSFGVLLWEVMSLGYMPYPGRGNQDVMQLVTSGGRLEPPNNCPQPVYHIMSQCWHAKPEERPNFITILERLGYCFQDPDVTNALLPVFHRPPSTERDATIMRANDPDNICLQVQRGEMEPQSPASTDYLIPIPSSSYSLCTEKTELQSASSLESVDRLLELDDKGDLPLNPVTSPLNPQPAPPAARTPNSWETSFMKAQAPVAWSGEYQSVPTQEDGGSRVPLATIPPPESSPARKSPPSAIARQRPSVKKPATVASGGLCPPPGTVVELDSQTGAINKTQLPLDPATLSKQHQAQVLPYANVAMANPPNGNEQRTAPFGATTTLNEPYTITAPRGAAPPSNKGKYDKDIKC